jgi:dihydroneopterin aldolase
LTEHHSLEPLPDVIVIDNLEVQAHIGVHDFEHGRAQAVRFDVEIETVPGYMRLVRETGNFVSYADVVAFIESKAASGKHVRLVEEWAASVAEFVLQNPLAAQITVSVLKTEIFERAGGVGIRICRRRG